MKRISRDPFRFEVFDLYASHAQQQKVTIDSKEAADQFVERVRHSVGKALDSETFIYGQHTQALFEALTISLGAGKSARARMAVAPALVGFLRDYGRLRDSLSSGTGSC